MLAAVGPVLRTLLVATAVVWFVFEIRQGSQQRPEAHAADRGSRMAIRVSVLLAFLGSLISRRAVPSATIASDAAAGWIGLVIMWCGVGLRLWSFQTLGRYFTFTVQTSPDQPVVSGGPYRVIRHPGYAGVLLTVVGIGFAEDNWVALAVMTTMFACGLVYRIIVEERALARDLGGRYEVYAAGRSRLLPRIW